MLKNLINNVYNELKVIDVLDETHLICECSCGEKTIVHISNLINGDIKSCGHVQNEPINITGKYYGEWYVDSYAGRRQWNVICSCGAKDIKDGGKIRNGYSKSCKRCGRLIDLKGKQFGDLEVLQYLGERMWLCRCSCGKEYPVIGSQLRSGYTKSCGHATTAFKDISGQKFGELTAIEYIGKQVWKCQCSCKDKTILNVDGRRLRFGMTRSCGCKSREFAVETMMKRYGEQCSLKINNPREDWQIEAIKSKENLEIILETFESKPTVYELGNMLGLEKSATLNIIHKFELDDKVDIGTSKSKYETEIIELIKSIKPNVEILQRDRNILNGKEIDIYLPEYKLAIEFNGDYWHNDEHRNKKAHQYKTLKCNEKGIRLIHIFEYEWNNIRKHKILTNMIIDILTDKKDKEVMHGRKLELKEVNSSDIKEFLDNNHLQGSINSNVNIAAYYKNEIVAVMSFSKPRFNSGFEYEITRMCYKQGIIIHGAAEKMFKYFIKIYKPSSVLTYTDISKFTGNVYLRLGFKLADKPITEPNYVWVKSYTGEVLSRYQTQKHKLVELGLNKYGDTEDEIMKNLGYSKIYDSGNIKLVYNH